MSTIQGVSPGLLAAMNGTGGTSGTGNAKSTAVEAQDRFMTLLVTQMKNQDPLNPLDNAQVTSQLAQLSTVTGIDKLNTTLEALMSSFQGGQSLQAASMIGRGVLVPGSDLALANGKAVLGIELAEPADKVTVTIRDLAGNAVRKIEVGSRDAGVAPLVWDGKTDAGAAAADGSYRFEVAATRGDEKTTASTLMLGEVVGVSTGAQGVRLNIPGVGETALSDVRQIL
jgi:flagellar basal-body rod modification protein FlgD